MDKPETCQPCVGAAQKTSARKNGFQEVFWTRNLVDHLQLPYFGSSVDVDKLIGIDQRPTESPQAVLFDELRSHGQFLVVA